MVLSSLHNISHPLSLTSHNYMSCHPQYWNVGKWYWSSVPHQHWVSRSNQIQTINIKCIISINSFYLISIIRIWCRIIWWWYYCLRRWTGTWWVTIRAGDLDSIDYWWWYCSNVIWTPRLGINILDTDTSFKCCVTKCKWEVTIITSSWNIILWPDGQESSACIGKTIGYEPQIDRVCGCYDGEWCCYLWWGSYLSTIFLTLYL